MIIARSNKIPGTSVVTAPCPSRGPKHARGRFVRQASGFTLVEVMIAIGIVSIVLGGIYAAFQNQIRTFNTQEQVVEMQQNIRVARYFMERELRIAGLNPTGNAVDGAGLPPGITVANGNTITISMDFTGGESDGLDNDGDGATDDGIDTVDNDADGLTDEPDESEWYNGIVDANESVTYALSNDANANGICDGLPTENDDGSSCNLLRNNQVVAANIDVLNFVYLGIDPADNSCTDDCLLLAPVVILDNIRSVQITLIARSGGRVRAMTSAYTDRNTYYNQPPANQIILPAQNDAFRRVRLTTNVVCRNLGL